MELLSTGLIQMAVCLLLLAALSPQSAHAEPESGDVFREYRMATGMFRVGERWQWGGSNSGKQVVLRQWHGTDDPYVVDLDKAVRAEVQVSYDQCHHSTTGLRIGFNGHAYHRLPVPETIPEPKARYMFWPFPTVEVPLDELREGQNTFRMRVDPDSRRDGKGWQQNLVYVVILRIYYSEDKPHPSGRVRVPEAGGALGPAAELEAEASSPNGPVRQVDFLGHYEGFDWDGDGVYREWHYAWHAGNQDEVVEMCDHLGSAKEAPWRVVWDTTWVPDQTQPMKVRARITDEAGMTYVTEPVEGLRLVRPGRSVEMCKPYNVQPDWVTREEPKSENFDIRGNLEQAVAARAICRNWGHNDGAGYALNGHELERFHPFTELPVKCLKSGQNTLTPHRGGHHGLEICWPGVVVFVRYEQDAAAP
jgi:hypothetical protein